MDTMDKMGIMIGVTVVLEILVTLGIIGFIGWVIMKLLTHFQII